jgi:mannose-6-phosphate isomerase-like protein (cupin superfamily)
MNPLAPATPERDPRPWGWFETLSLGPDHLVKRLWLAPGCRLSLQRHQHRWEHWVVVSGAGTVEIDGQVQAVEPGSTLTIAQRAVHRASAGPEGLLIVEVQRGGVLREDDIERLQDDYGRVLSS